MAWLTSMSVCDSTPGAKLLSANAEEEARQQVDGVGGYTARTPTYTKFRPAIHLKPSCPSSSSPRRRIEKLLK